MKQIIAIGGGSFASKDSNLKIEKYVLAQAKKEKPKVCFLPQASHETQDYIVKFFETFCDLGAEPSWISLFGRVEDTWRQTLLEQDIIYVGGGNTKSMLALWKAWGMDQVLMEAYQKGTILSGVSAGAICWFEQGITDSVWPLGVIDGLGFIKGSCCPHFDSEKERQSVYRDKVNTGVVKPGIALEDGTAAHFINGDLNGIIKSDESKKAIQINAGSENLIKTQFLD